MIIWYGKMAYICAICVEQADGVVITNECKCDFYIYVKKSDCRKTLQMTLNESMREGK